MPRIKLEETIEYLYDDIQPALAKAVKEIIPDAEFESGPLFRAFLKEIGRRQRDWVTIPSNLIDSTW
jgi:hypothetical protein